MSLFFTAHNNKEGGIKKSFGRQKMLGTAKPSGVIFFGTKGRRPDLFRIHPPTEICRSKTKGPRWSYEKSTLGEAENKEKGSTESKTSHTVLQAKPYSYLPATSDRGERVSNGLPGQTVKGRDCNTEEGGCFGNAEAPDDDHCNPAHVWNFSFPVYP